MYIGKSKLLLDLLRVSDVGHLYYFQRLYYHWTSSFYVLNDTKYKRLVQLFVFSKIFYMLLENSHQDPLFITSSNKLVNNVCIYVRVERSYVGVYKLRLVLNNEERSRESMNTTCRDIHHTS